MHYLGFLYTFSTFAVNIIARPFPSPLPQYDLAIDGNTYPPKGIVSNNINFDPEPELILLASDDTGDGNFIFHLVNLIAVISYCIIEMH